MKHLGTAIFVLVVPSGYLIVLNKLQEFRLWIRTIPTDYILTPLIFLGVAAGALWNINRKQRHQLSQILKQPQSTTDTKGNFVTHLGVWWKMYPDLSYIEDMPYCPCCETKKKLVQIEWYPNEIFKCPITGTEIKLFDRIPQKKRDVLQGLYQAYFSGDRLEREMMDEFERLKELHPNEDDLKLARRIFNLKPFNKIPKEEINNLFTRFQQPHEIFFFLQRNYRAYKRYLKRQ